MKATTNRREIYLIVVTAFLLSYKFAVNVSKGSPSGIQSCIAVSSFGGMCAGEQSVTNHIRCFCKWTRLEIYDLFLNSTFIQR